jgi:hypothetical protein
MTVIVRHLNDESVESFRGEPQQIARQLVARFPWAHTDPINLRHDYTDFQDVISRVGRSQNISLKVEA